MLSGYLAGRKNFSFLLTGTPRCGDACVIELYNRKSDENDLKSLSAHLGKVEERTSKQNGNFPKFIKIVLEKINGFIVWYDDLLSNMLKESIGF